MMVKLQKRVLFDMSHSLARCFSLTLFEDKTRKIREQNEILQKGKHALFSLSLSLFLLINLRNDGRIGVPIILASGFSAVRADRRATAGEVASRPRQGERGGVGRSALVLVAAVALLALVVVFVVVLVGKVGRGARGGRASGRCERGRGHERARVQRVAAGERGLDDRPQAEQLALELAVLDLERLDEEGLAGPGALGGLAAEEEEGGRAFFFFSRGSAGEGWGKGKGER